MPVSMLPIADVVQEEYKKFAAINVVAHGELFGGKICAALDRQHPRDLFDTEEESEGKRKSKRKGVGV